MINLCLVVIATQFSETKQREHRLMLEQRQRYLSSSTVASYAEPGDCYEEIFQYVCHILRKAKRRALGLYQALRLGNMTGVDLLPNLTISFSVMRIITFPPPLFSFTFPHASPKLPA